MTTQHTPGPWFAWRGDQVGKYWVSQGSTGHGEGSSGDICIFNNNSRRDELEVAANASLIAAAPELLAALKVAWDILPALPVGHEHYQQYSQIEAAIAKATGGC